MKKPLCIMFDIDGVLADFTLGITYLAADVFGIGPRDSSQVNNWDYSEFMSNKEFYYLLDTIKRTPGFWKNLPPAVGMSPEDFGRINLMTRRDKVYFVTSRIENGRTMQETWTWFFKHGIQVPNIIMTKKKGEFARAVGADYSIDDKWENAHCIHWLSDSPQTKSYLINRPYNRLLDDKVGSKGVIRVDTVKQYLDDIERSL